MTDFWGDTSDPSAAEVTAFTNFKINLVTTLPVVTESGDTFKNKIGMYTVASKDNSDITYYKLWLEFEPNFVSKGAADGSTNEDEATWCNYALEQTNQTFRLYF